MGGGFGTTPQKEVRFQQRGLEAFIYQLVHRVGADPLQGDLRGHLTGPLASGHICLPLLSPLLPLEQPTFPLILLHAHHVAANRAREQRSGSPARPSHAPDRRDQE